jgi:hypothetical protein
MTTTWPLPLPGTAANPCDDHQRSLSRLSAKEWQEVVPHRRLILSYAMPSSSLAISLLHPFLAAVPASVRHGRMARHEQSARHPADPDASPPTNSLPGPCRCRRAPNTAFITIIITTAVFLDPRRWAVASSLAGVPAPYRSVQR